MDLAVAMRGIGVVARQATVEEPSIVALHHHEVICPARDYELILNMAIQLRTSIDTTKASSPRCDIPCSIRVESRAGISAGKCRRHICSTFCKLRALDRRCRA